MGFPIIDVTDIEKHLIEVEILKNNIALILATTDTFANHPHQDVTTVASPSFRDLTLTVGGIIHSNITAINLSSRLMVDELNVNAIGFNSTNRVLSASDGSTQLNWTTAGAINLIANNLSTTGVLTGGRVQADNIRLDTNQITSNTGTISLDDDHLTTTGKGTFGELTVDNININDNIITSDTGTISLNDENLTTTGTGTFGQIIDNGLTASLGVYTDGSKQLTSTPPSTGVLGYWSRTGTQISTANAGDDLILTDNLTLDLDSIGTIYGASQDMSMTWNGTGGVIDPRLISDSTGLKIGVGVNETAAEVFEVTGHLNFDQVAGPTNAMGDTWDAGLSETGSGSSFSAGEYHYSIRFVCNDGKTVGITTSGSYPDITISSGSDITHADIPISPDPRVTSREIFRTEANEGYLNAQLVHTINDNTTTTWVDDGSVVGTGGRAYRLPNTTAGIIKVNDIKSMFVDMWTTSFGLNALDNLDGGADNVAIGYQALLDLTSGSNNIGIGTQAGRDFTTTSNNVSIGLAASRSNTGGDNNVAIGNSALILNSEGSCDHNVGVGDRALYLLEPAKHRNTAIGYRSGYQSSGNDNVFVGYYAGYGAARRNIGDDNIIIGSMAADNIGAGANRNIIIGANLDLSAIDVDDELNIGGIIIGDMSTEQVRYGKVMHTALGGIAVQLTNKTGANSVAGQLVKADTATNDAVILTAAGDTECFGVFLESGITDGSEAWVVVSGIADVAFDDNVASVRGDWVSTGVAAGYAATGTSPAVAPTHFEEIGHCIETVSAGGGGTHILARCVLHFN